MIQINFNENWNNKLDCKAFTTIRIKSAKFKKEAIHAITLKSKLKGHAKVIDVKHFKLKDLNEFMARLDTGYSMEETKVIIKTIYKKQYPDTLTFSFILYQYENL